MTVIHRQISNKLLFTEKHDTKSPLAPFEDYSPSRNDSGYWKTKFL